MSLETCAVARATVVACCRKANTLFLSPYHFNELILSMAFVRRAQKKKHVTEVEFAQ